MEIKISEDQNAIQVKEGGEVKQLKSVVFNGIDSGCLNCYFKKNKKYCHKIPCNIYERNDEKLVHFTEEQ